MVKNFVINKSLNMINEIFPDYDKIKMDEIRYGLESIYLSLTKVIVILFATFLLGIFKEAAIVLLFFNLLRATAFGIHATKSWMCWVSSSILFIGIPYLCMYYVIPTLVQYAIICFSMVCYLLYAPADTKKRPLVKKKKRIRFKVLTLITAVAYLLLFVFIDNFFIKNVIVYSMILEAVLIHPLTYKVFKLPYKNYKGYVFSK